MIVSRSVYTPPPRMARHPRGSYIVKPIAVSVSAHTRNKITSLMLSSICESASQAVLSRMHSPFMRLALHFTALRAWCKQCLSGRWKPDMLRPGIVGMRGSMVIRLWPRMRSSTPLLSSTPPPPWPNHTDWILSLCLGEDCAYVPRRRKHN